MKTQSSLRKNTHERSGVALIIVLSIIVLLSGLLVAFMSSVGTESASAKAAVRGIEARQIGESAVNLAISQIREATRGDSSAPTAWASQPGAIRQFDDKGKDKRVYKLYSALSMVAENGEYPPGFNPANPSAPVNPDQIMKEAGIIADKMDVTPTAFTDLNYPDLVPVQGDPEKVYVRYPIADPRAAEGLPGVVKDFNAVPTRVQGFTVADIRHPNTSVSDVGQFAFSDQKVRLLPMRARWLFQLRDGTLVPGVPLNGDGVNDGKIKVEGATEQNPIVGRFAFWTDDETGKICINTGSENTFWDTPHASTLQESGKILANQTMDPSYKGLALGASQPARSEFQRFPGHPATTSLYPSLRWLFGSATSDVIEREYKEAIYRMAPRIYGGVGSSVAGSQITEYVTDSRVYEKDRLFNSLDEYWFRPDRTPLFKDGLYTVFSGGKKDAAQKSEFFTPEAFEMMRFFLTASNRSSDLNLWGMPKVSIWPVHSTDDPNPKASRRSGFDDLISFCATTGSGATKKAYYFTRNNPWSPTGDISLTRNVELLDYLTALTDSKVPGVGASFAQKYSTPTPAAYNAAKAGTERDQILTQIFDYIRSTNLVDTGRKDGTPPPPAGSASYPLAYTPGYGSLNGGSKPQLGSGQVVPSQRVTGGAVTSMGFGRFVTVSEVAILFYRDASTATLLPSDAAGTVTNPMRAVVLVEMTTPSPGYPALSEGYAYTITEPTPFKIAPDKSFPANLQNLDFGSGETNMVEVDVWRGPYGRFFMPTRGFANQFWYDSSINAATPTPKKFWRTGAVAPKPGDDYSFYPFFSRRFSMTGPAGTNDFLFKGGEFQIDIHALNPTFPVAGSSVASFHPTKGPKIQSIRVKFPEATLRLPSAAPEFQQRITNMNAFGDRDVALGWVNAGDTIRSMELNGAAKADTRLAAARPVVTADMFSPAVSQAEYNNTASLRVHNLRISWGQRYSGARQGVYAAGATARSDKTVDIPQEYNGVPLAGNSLITGDYDRGMSKHIDGAFINKADEGNTRYNFSAADLSSGGGVPYYRGGNGYEETGQTYFSPNRLISSAVMFGSLPTGVYSMQPWQTLLFRPGYGGHKGAQAPSDHYLLDLFSMPVVEPYAISEPLSSQGRQNLNCRLAPFGYVPKDGAGDPITSRAYVERTTGLHAVLRGMYQMAVPNGTPDAAHTEAPYTSSATLRFPIDPYETISQGIIQKNFFRTPSQICDIDLIIKSPTTKLTGNPVEGKNTSNRQAFWEAHNMTGDNMRERPYSHIYPRLTTKSNTYTVYVNAQSLSKRKKSNWDEFDETEDLITGEYRGSSTVERFIDPNGEDVAKYDAVKAAKDKKAGLESFYRFRIINTKKFIAR